MPHSITEIIPTKATGPGALDGFDALCTCGARIGSSLRTLAAAWGRDHAAYYNQKEGHA